MTPEQRERLRAAAEKATPGPWLHVNAYKTVPAARTVHGTVPGQRVDYVSTWDGPGTPAGHRVVIDMDGRERAPRSDDMAFIALANPAAVLALLDALEVAEARATAAEALLKDVGNWSEYEDEIAEAISGSMDMDWTSQDGARAVVRFLDALAAGRAILAQGGEA